MCLNCPGFFHDFDPIQYYVVVFTKKRLYMTLTHQGSIGIILIVSTLLIR